jgi:glycosyltransferase involved in cell wall biosynthesis
VKIAVVAGICVERDAISAAASDQAEMLGQLDGVGDVVLITQWHDRLCAARTVTVGDPWSLVLHPEIEQSDLVIFHWGIRYQLFNALPVIAAERRTAVHFHNITPAHLLPEADRTVIEESIRQIQLPLLTNTKMWAVSAYNRATLADWGYPEEQTRLVPFPVGHGRHPLREIRAHDCVRLLTVGRLVPAKGVGVLVTAMRSVVRELGGKVSLVLAGSTELSNREYITELTDAIRRHALDRHVDIKEDLDDRALALEYERADVLVSPSLHEGLCIPVIEAYLAGCTVVGTEAGNLPYIVQPPDPVVPAGDPDALADAIVTMGREVLAGVNRVPDGAAAVIAMYSAENTRRELAAAVAELAPVRFGAPVAQLEPGFDGASGSSIE